MKMKTIGRCISLVLAMTLAFCTASTARASSPDPATKKMKVLVVGNSFSGNAAMWLTNIFKSAGIPEESIQVSYLFIGSCTLATHAGNIRTGAEAYDYYRCSPKYGAWIIDGKISIKDALLDEAWDIIATHQGSEFSGVAETYNEDLDVILSCFKQYAPQAKLYWLMTWPYGTRFTGSEFSRYNNNQKTMYEGILNAVQTKICPNQSFAGIGPLGTVTQKMLDAGFSEAQIYSDNRHLNLHGQYAVGLAFAVTLGVALEEISFVPEGITKNEAERIRSIVADAIANPGYHLEPMDDPGTGSAPPSPESTEPIPAESNDPSLPEPAGGSQTQGSASSGLPYLIGSAALLCLSLTGLVLALRKKPR